MLTRRRWRMLMRGLFVLGVGTLIAQAIFTSGHASDRTVVWMIAGLLAVLAAGLIKFYVLRDDLQIRGEPQRYGRLTRRPPPED